MLLDLIDHHGDLFLGILEPLIWRRDWRNLAASDIVQKHGYKEIKPNKKHVWVKN
jgi:hypothetical protein